MKPTLYLLGKTKTDLSSGSLAIKGNRAQWSSRLIQVEGPKPSELSAFDSGSFSIEMWEQLLAGTMSLEQAKSHDFPDTWRESPAFNWLPVTNDGASYGKAFAALKHIVRRDSPRNYGTVINCADGQLCATDGFRLSYFELPTMNPMVFPAFGLSLAIKLLKGSSSIQITEDGSMIRICSGEWVAHFRAANIKFPNYKTILPSQLKPLAMSLAQSAVDQAELKAKVYPKDPSKHGPQSFAEVQTEEGTIFFNPIFFRELSGFESFAYSDAEGPLKATKGNQVYIVVPVKVPEPKKQSVSA